MLEMSPFLAVPCNPHSMPHYTIVPGRALLARWSCCLSDHRTTQTCRMQRWHCPQHGSSSMQSVRNEPTLGCLLNSPLTEPPHKTASNLRAVSPVLPLVYPLKSAALSLLIAGSNYSAGLIELRLHFPPELFEQTQAPSWLPQEPSHGCLWILGYRWCLDHHSPATGGFSVHYNTAPLLLLLPHVQGVSRYTPCQLPDPYIFL